MPAAPPSLNLPPRYRPTRRLGTGGMAGVWAAQDTVLGREVAVKVLSRHVVGDSAALARFEREARAAARVSDHPHVVTIYDVGEAAGEPFIVMELRPGGTVGERMAAAGGLVPSATALAWLDDAAQALDHAHRHGVVHRDIKPANLLLDRTGRVAVADFGIARLGDDSAVTSTGEVLGTAAYLSPEQALGREATAASDRYALGVVAFELLTGGRPFEASSAAAQARQHADSPPPVASSVAPELPASVDGVLARALAKDPEARWPTAGAMVGALETAMNVTASDAVPATAVTRVVPVVAGNERAHTASIDRGALATRAAPRRGDPAMARDSTAPVRRGRLLPLAALALVLLLVGGLVAALVGGSDGTQRSRSASATARTSNGTTTVRSTRSVTTTARPPATTAAPATAAPVSGDSSALQSRGHALLASGDAAGAIPVLQAAAKDCPVSRTDPCAFALYDLGLALTQAGRREEAAAVLRQRLENPNQRGAVLAALAAAGGGDNGAGGKPGKEAKPRKTKSEG